jgi:hypothetical protein
MGQFSRGVSDGLTFTATISGTQMSGSFADVTGSLTLTLQ